MNHANWKTEALSVNNEKVALQSEYQRVRLERDALRNIDELRILQDIKLRLSEEVTELRAQKKELGVDESADDEA